MYVNLKRLPVFVLLGLMLLSNLFAAPPALSASPAPAASAPDKTSDVDTLAIPSSQTTPKVDGFCDEYLPAGAKTETFTDGNGQDGTVYLLHNGGYLYICMQTQLATFQQHFARVYLDPQGDGAGYIFANQGDHGFEINPETGGMPGYSGTGVANGWTNDPSLDAFWDGAFSTSANGETYEYRLNAGRLGFGSNCQLFALATYHHWFSAVGDDYGWPSNQFFDQPRTWQLAWLDSPACQDVSGRIAYVFRGNTADAVSFYNLLTGAGYTVDLVPLSDVTSTDFSLYDLILVATDTGNLNQWGIPTMTAAQVGQITLANKPIIGLGEGGYAFFGQLTEFIGWPNGWHGPQDQVKQAATAPAPYFSGLGDPVTAYSMGINSVGIYLAGGPPPSGVIPVGLEVPTNDHASLIMQNCHLLWGNQGNPLAMTVDGKTLFLNAVAYMHVFQCPPSTPPPPETCIDVVKSANPPAGSAVAPGDVIEYTVTVTYSDNPDCGNPDAARLLDSIPVGTMFVPGSASDGISPGADGALRWVINPAAAPQVKTFKVIVTENLCTGPKMVHNRAGLLVGSNPPVISNVVSHPVTCQPVILPNDEPPFAQNEISVHPYPLINGQPSTIQVRLHNDTGSAQPVHVAFQTSPNRFGIGLNFGTFDTASAVIPAHGSVVVQGTFTPASSGHYCIQIVVTGPGLSQPLVSQRNIDVTEELVAGTPDSLTFKVRNNSSSTADITLVVDNTCPGWNAVITNPAGGVLTNMAPDEVRDATLTVTPPNPVMLGSGCHIDVQGWIGDTLIGGIRKLDVPPVQLPSDVNPPWEEPEISFNPDPPTVGQDTQFCVELQNPLPITTTVTVDFAIADFGAGIPFTSIGVKNFVLPPNSINQYCITWTPATSGTLHRCALVTLIQPGYQDMHSQHNVDLRRVTPGAIGSLDIPFVIFNPDLVGHQVTITPTLVGIDPYWVPHIVPDPGDPPPNVIMPGQSIMLHLQFMPMSALAGGSPQAVSADPSHYQYGDVSKVEVSILFDGAPVGGFSLQLESGVNFMPIIYR